MNCALILSSLKIYITEVYSQVYVTLFKLNVTSTLGKKTHQRTCYEASSNTKFLRCNTGTFYRDTSCHCYPGGCLVVFPLVLLL